jgi:hypothetical protein
MSTVTKEKFEKAVEIIRKLPKEGPIQPTQEDQLFVGTLFFSYVVLSPNWALTQFYSYFKQGGFCEAQLWASRSSFAPNFEF